MKAYAGIGSRNTPPEILEEMGRIANFLGQLGYTLRSGGAKGADQAFEKSAYAKQIFLPWAGFEARWPDEKEYFVRPWNAKTDALIQEFYPKPDRLSQGSHKLMVRNSYQVLGYDLNSPVDFVVCWTKDGKASGGTGQAIRIARAYKIPVINLKTRDFPYHQIKD